MTTNEAIEAALSEDQPDARDLPEPNADASAPAEARGGAARAWRIRILRARPRLRPGRPRFVAAVLVIILTGTTTIWAHSRAQALHSTAAARNAALTDVATTAAAKTQITQAVEALFSFDFSNPAKTDAAGPADLIGAAVSQYTALMAPVRAHAADLKLALTTTVTSAGVQTLQGDRARILVFADQNDTSAATAGTSESAVAFAVDAVRVGGTWRIAGIDTLGA